MFGILNRDAPARAFIFSLGGFFSCLAVVTSNASEPIRLVSDPAISPDGQQIAFAWRDDIWTASIDGGPAEQITTDDASDSQPHFSPDGTKLAYVSDRTGSPQIYIVDIDGGSPRQVTFHSEGYKIHDWFPGGQFILASGNRDHHWRGAERLLKVSVEDRRADQVLADATATDASLDRKGESVLFVREGERWWRKGYRGERAAQIWKLDLADGTMTEILHEGVGCRWPVWLRDGDSFLFTKGDHKGYGLWKFDFAQPQDDQLGEQQQLTKFDDDSIVFPAVSRDSNVVVFRHLFDLYKYNIDQDDAPQKIELTYQGDPTIDPDELRRELDRATEVTFTKDGLEMVFVAGGDLWAMDTELKEPIRLTDTGAHESSVIFGPDEASLFTVAKRDGQVDIYEIKRSDDRYWWQPGDLIWTRITNDPTVESDLKLSPDEKHLFYVRGLGAITRRQLFGDQATVQLTNAFSSPEYDITPCGSWIAYAQSDNDFNSEIWIRRSDGSTDPINISQHPDDDSNPKFSPDGNLLAFTGRRVDTEQDIHYVWLQSEQSERTNRQRALEQALEKMKKKRKASEEKDEKPEKEKDDKANPTENGQDDQKAADKDSVDDSDEASEDDQDDSITETVIDFDRIEERVKRIAIEDSRESNLFWSPDGEKLAFVATIDGQRATYTVTFPDELTPKKLTSETIGQPNWTKAADAILGHLSGVPASVDPNGKTTKYEFNAKQILARSERFRDGFEEAWAIMRDRWYDPKHANRNWAEVRRKYIDMATAAGDDATFAEVITLMLGELNGSHNGFYPNGSRNNSRDGWPDTTAHLGVRFDDSHAGPGLRVRDVLIGGPSDREDGRLFAGDLIIAIDDVPVDPGMDLTTILNGDLDRDIKLLVSRTVGDDNEDDHGGEKEELLITIRPISFAAARSLLYENWLVANRQTVEDLSDGKLGYLHIRAMSIPSFYDFERELYRVGYGRDGLVIDVRDNGGGSTTDLLLTALTQPRHATTVPRGGGPGYPQSRMVYAVWQKPIVVLCNQNSYSNAEIFSHAIKNLGRGQLVGVETAGGVISTGSVSITDVGRMRMPFRGWFVSTTGEDMEMNGAVPDHILWPLPGEIPKGIDKQLELAVDVLTQEIADQPPADVELIYASERQPD
jgi:tricorn protease